jgi:UPF0755 protein
VCLVLLTRPITLRDDGFVYVPRNASILTALDSVQAHANVVAPWLARLAARVIGRTSNRSVHAGWYKLDSAARTIDAITMLFSAAQRPAVRVTLPEGVTIYEMASILARTAEVDSARFVAWCTSSEVTQDANLDAASMEGYLMPDTYDVHWREEAEVVGNMLHTTFLRRWTRDIVPLLSNGERTQHQLLTLASIVQAEAAVEDEMERIAGVYVNRLNIGMKLEADPTVQYGLGRRHRVLYNHLESESPYNTFRHTGLPPGPINNPGIAAIRAAIKPEAHHYLYFVAHGDGSGRHRFASSGAEHVRNVGLYRRRRAGR